MVGTHRKRVGELVQHREGRAVFVGLWWWVAALASIAVVNVPPSNHAAGMVVFGATVFGAGCAFIAPFGLDRSSTVSAGALLVALAVLSGVVAVGSRLLLFPTEATVVAYTQTPAEIPAVVAGSVGSFALLYTVGAVLCGAVRRARTVDWAGRAHRKPVVGGETDGTRFDGSDGRRQ